MKASFLAPENYLGGTVFPLGTLVTWNKDTPTTWRFIYTPGPMTVVSARWSSGISSEYLRKFEMFGDISLKPGWIVTVEYLADSKYYDPPLSLLCGKKRIQKEIHQMWLTYDLTQA